MKIQTLLAVLALGMPVLGQAAGADGSSAPAPCKTCTPPAASQRAGAGARRVSQAAEPAPGWNHPTDQLALEALQTEILRNVGKYTQDADYPEEARRWNWSGIALVHVLVTGTGRLKDVSVERSSGFRVLDDQAVRMVERAQSTRVPDRLKGREVEVTVPIGFYIARK